MNETRSVTPIDVIWVPVADNEGSRKQQRNFLATVGDHHRVAVFDYDRPLAPQFEEKLVVVDHGGSAGTHEMMDAAVDARLWQILGTGFDHVDIEYLKARDHTVCNTPGLFTADPMAEVAMMMIIMLVRQYNESVSVFRQRGLSMPRQGEVMGRTLGVIGFGATGRALAKRAKAFGVPIKAVDPIMPAGDVIAEHGVDSCVPPDQLDAVIAEVDVLSIHLHLNAETRHVIDARRIGLMKPDALLINVSRGELVDEEALHETLLDRRIGGAGLDVFGEELTDPDKPAYALPNVIVTPHNSGATQPASLRRCACALENIERIAQGLEPLHRIA